MVCDVLRKRGNMKLLVLDVEGTLFKTMVKLPGTNLDSTIWQSLAKVLGTSAIQEEIKTHVKWENNKYTSYLDWMKDTIHIHQKYKLSQQLFNTVINNAQYNDGVIETFNKIDRQKYEFVLVSGGFRELAIRAQKDLGIIHSFAACEYLFNIDGSLHTFNLLPCDFEGKISFINLMLREYNIDSHDWIFIGDGANDVPIAQQAPLSIGYKPHPALAAVVDYQITSFKNILTYL
jgi:phosphoserine phosphatase